MQEKETKILSVAALSAQDTLVVIWGGPGVADTIGLGCQIDLSQGSGAAESGWQQLSRVMG